MVLEANENAADQPRSIARSALKFFSGTALSRISGLLRDMSMAFFFGANPSIAAFLVAFRLANLLRRVFGEGALLNSFVPHFESCRKENPIRAAQFFRDTFFSLISILVVLLTSIELLLYYFLVFFSISDDSRQILQLIMLILPGVLFICLFSLCSGLLHCEKYFFLSGFSPVAFNAVWIASIWIVKNDPPEKAVLGLSLGVTIAFLCQWFVTIPKTISFLLKYLSWKEIIFKFCIFSKEMRNMLSSLSLGVIGVGAAQINTAMDTMFARYASLEGPAYLNYAIHLQQLPLALIGIGISTALLPPLSRACESDNSLQYNRLLEFSLSLALFLVIPCTLAIFSIGGSSVNLIFGRGNFDVESTLNTTLCLWGYGLGLVPMVVTLLLAPAFYAKKDYLTPMKASLVSISLNLLLNLLLVCVFSFGPESLALSTSISAFCNALILWKKLNKKNQLSFTQCFYSSNLKTMISAGIAGIGSLMVGHYFLNDPTVLFLCGQKIEFIRNFSDQILQFLSLALLFSCLYLGSSLLLKSSVLLDFLKVAKKQIS